MNSNREDGSTPRIGGQAIIEGVMMRSPEYVSAAVRLPGGEIQKKVWPSKPWYKRRKFLGWPIMRGIASLSEALVLGIRTLNWSADVALESEREGRERAHRKWDALGMAGSLLFAIAIAIALFMLVPYQLANILKTSENQPLFHLVAGTVRIALFLAYIWLISQLKDIRRVFQYHGAEHQAIFTYENREELTSENARNKSCFHPRCGTSYLLIVALLTMAFFVLFDTAVVAIWGSYRNVLVRLLVHLPALPLVAGASYELLRLSDRLSHTPFFRALITPGLALQRMTTRPPDDTQREVALCALIAALPNNESRHVEESELQIRPLAD